MKDNLPAYPGQSGKARLAQIEEVWQQVHAVRLWCEAVIRERRPFDSATVAEGYRLIRLSDVATRTLAIELGVAPARVSH